MNYIRQINAFYDVLETNPLSAPAIALWHALHAIANKTGWQNEFSVSVSILGLRAGLDAKAVQRARNKLKEVGLIDWKSRGANRAAVYRLIEIGETIENKKESGVPHFVPHSVPHFVPHSVPQCVPINKLNEKETKQEDIPPNPPKGARIDYAGVVELFNRTCPSLPKVRDLTDARKKAIAARMKEHNTMDDFREVFAAVERSSFLTGRSGSWHGCGFDWILRPSNWQKIKEGNYDDEDRRDAGRAASAHAAHGRDKRPTIGIVL